MNRHHRRSAAAQGRQGASSRADVLRVAMDHLRSASASATGATVLLPDGEQLYIALETADAMAPLSRNYAEQMTAIHEEAGGLMNLDVVLRDDLPAMIAAAANGDVEAAELAQRVNAALFDIGTASASKAKLCATCPRPLAGGRFSLALATPACNAPSSALALAVCHHCASNREDARNKATEALRRIWPDARSIVVTHPDGGRA